MLIYSESRGEWEKTQLSVDKPIWIEERSVVVANVWTVICEVMEEGDIRGEEEESAVKERWRERNEMFKKWGKVCEVIVEGGAGSDGSMCKIRQITNCSWKIEYRY